MNKHSLAEKAFKKELIIASLLFALFFIAILSTGGYIIIKDLGEKEVFRTLDHYRTELEKMTTNIPETEIAKGFKYEKIVTTRLNQFMVDKQIFDSLEVYDPDGKLIYQQDYLKQGGIIAGPSIKGPPLGQSHIEIRNKVPIEVPIQLAPGKMGKAVLNVSDQVLSNLAKDFRNQMIFKFAVMLTLIFFMLFISYLYVIRLLRKSRIIQQEGEEQNRLSYLGLLSSGLAHEIKNPLNALKLNIQLLEEGLKGNADREDLLGSVEPMLNQIKRLEKLTRDFLMYSKPLEPEFRNANIDEIISEICLSYSEEAKEKNIEVLTKVDGTSRDIEGDENMLRIIVSNLLINAIQASEHNQKVEVNLSFKDSVAEIDVIDFGSGIEEEMKEKIFDVFFTTKPEGTGLGLSIVKRLVEAHKGSIQIVPSEKGAHFRVAFPYTH